MCVPREIITVFLGLNLIWGSVQHLHFHYIIHFVVSIQSKQKAILGLANVPAITVSSTTQGVMMSYFEDILSLSII